MQGKRIKTEVSGTHVGDDANDATANYKGSIREQLTIQQSLMKATVQQLHLIPKFNSLSNQVKSSTFRNQQVAVQFALLLSIRDCLLVQHAFSNKGRMHVSQVSELLKEVEKTILAFAKFETKATTKQKETFDVSLESISVMMSDYMDSVFTAVGVDVDKWNAAVMGRMANNQRTVIKSPISLANEVQESSKTILDLYKPTQIDSLLTKRPEMSSVENSHLYEDTPMTHQILKDLLKIGRAFRTELTEQIQFGNTEQYLRDRQQRKSTKKEKVQYDERKDRKIKFEIHEKLVDFMPIIPHEALADNRDQIIANLFGQTPKEAPRKKRSSVDESYFQDVSLV